MRRLMMTRCKLFFTVNNDDDGKMAIIQTDKEYKIAKIIESQTSSLRMEFSFLSCYMIIHACIIFYLIITFSYNDDDGG